MQTIIARLRSEFVFDRGRKAAADDPLADFLDARRGGDHLFATAAATMLSSLGYRTRLVAGFYADPDDFTPSRQQTVIGPEDAHVWVEVAVAPRVWLPIEPTPGYAPPRLYRSLWSRAKEAAWAGAPWAVAIALLGLLAWWSRPVWGDALCAVVWTLSKPLDGRGRLRVLMWVLEMRCQLARHPRPAGVPQRRWFGTLAAQVEASLETAAGRCFDAADALSFCPGNTINRSWLVDADALARRLTVQSIAASELPQLKNPRCV